MNAYSYGERYANDMEPTGERSKGIKPRVNESSQAPVQEGFESHKRTEHNSLPFSAFCLLQEWQFQSTLAHLTGLDHPIVGSILLSLRVILYLERLLNILPSTENRTMNEPVDRPEEKVEWLEINTTTGAEKVRTVEVETTIDSTGVNTEEKVRVEEFSISGDDLVAKVRELIHQGNIRRITIKAEEGRTLIEIPLTVGVVGGVIAATLFPVVAAVGAIGALVARLKVVIEKVE